MCVQFTSTNGGFIVLSEVDFYNYIVFCVFFETKKALLHWPPFYSIYFVLVDLDGGTENLVRLRLCCVDTVQHALLESSQIEASNELVL